VEKTKTICLCGSTKFKEDFDLWNMAFTISGYVVFSCGVFAHDLGIPLTDGEKDILDNVHKIKISMSDEIFVINKDGYIGSSTKSEICYAYLMGKKVNYMSSMPSIEYARVHELITGYKNGRKV
jgi:hypothetical protein